MLADRRDHFGVLTVSRRMVGPHRALQLGELTDHRRQQIALAEVRGARDERAIRTQLRRERRSQRADAADLVADRAELGLEGDGIETRTGLGERLAPVLRLEERRIGEARAHHALVALAHARGFAAFDVAHRDEARKQCALVVLDREVALVFLQGAEQHLARQREEVLLEAALDRHRPLDQRGDLIEQRVVHHRTATERRGAGGDGLADARAAFREIGDDEALLAQHLGIVGRRGDHERLRRMEAVAAGRRTGIGVEQARGQHRIAQAHQHPVHGTHELGLARAPAHALRDRQRIERGLDDAGQQRRGGGAGFLALEGQELALALGDAPERFERDTAALGEGRGRARRCTLLVEGGVDRWAATLDLLFGLRRRQCAHQHSEPPRCCVGLHRAVPETRRSEPRGDALGERTLELRQRERRQFFGAELEEEILHGGHGVFSAAVATGAAPCNIGKPSVSRAS